MVTGPRVTSSLSGIGVAAASLVNATSDVAQMTVNFNLSFRLAWEENRVDRINGINKVKRVEK